MLKLTDEILNEFFEYTKPIRQDDEHHDIMTLHNFFGSHVWNDTAKGILKSALKRRRDRFNEIRDSFKKLKNIK